MGSTLLIIRARWRGYCMVKIKELIGAILVFLSYVQLYFAYLVPINMYAGKGEGLPYVVDIDGVEVTNIFCIFAVIFCVIASLLYRKKIFLCLGLVSVILNINRIFYLSFILEQVDKGILMGR